MKFQITSIVLLCAISAMASPLPAMGEPSIGDITRRQSGGGGRSWKRINDNLKIPRENVLIYSRDEAMKREASGESAL